MFVLAAARCSALNIELLYEDEFARRPGAVSGMERAARMWEGVLDDPITVTIGVRELPATELGFNQAVTYRTFMFAEYDVLRDALKRDVTSDADATAVLHLPLIDRVTFRAVDPSGSIAVFDGQDNFNMYLDIPAANARALGLDVDLPPGMPDAEIELNATMLDLGILDVDRADPGGISGSDFVSVAAHEIGHALGFLSGTDDFDDSSLPNGPFAPEDLSEYAILNVPDLFRYSPESLPLNDVAPGGDPYFSVDGGATRLGDFASGLFHGDGNQAGHWKDLPVGAGEMGLMDASLAESVPHKFSPLDLIAMDVIGWDVSPPVAGDYNADRIVDQVDLDLVLMNWGKAATAPPNDWLLDLPTDTIDQDELDKVLGNWGATRAVAAAAVVPEPRAAALLAIGLAAAAGLRRRSDLTGSIKLIGQPRDWRAGDHGPTFLKELSRPRE